MNKQSNLYTVIYIVLLTVIVGAALAVTSLSLRDRQQQNIDAEKMRQILASVHVTPAKGDIVTDFNRLVTSQYLVNSKGERIDGDAFSVNVAAQIKEKAADRLLPVYECHLPEDGSTKYILPLYGAGLWGPIWGYIAIDSDGSTIYGAFFAHQGETPGLGAEIEKPAFSDQFDNLSVFKDGVFKPVAVVKKGMKPLNGEDYVDGISGGTITSQGVSSMLANCLKPYECFLEKLRNNN